MSNTLTTCYCSYSFWATTCKMVRPMLSDRCPVCLTGCDVGVLWPNGWMDQNAKSIWHGGRPRPRPHCVRWDPSPHQKTKGTIKSPQFSAHLCFSQTTGRIKMPLGMEVGLGPSDIVLDGDPTPPSKKGHSSPHFSAHVY